MLIKFAVKNYRGFAEKIEWDLANPSNYEFNKNAVNNGVVKNGIIYGPNGCGKTNFGLAIFDIVNHLTQKVKKADYYLNFVSMYDTNSPVSFEYKFKFGEKIVEYDYSKDANGVLVTEKLVDDGDVVLNRETSNFYINEKLFAMDAAVKKNLESNANNISIVNYLLLSYPLSKDNCLMQLQKFVNSMLWFRCLDVREFIGLDNNITYIEEYIIRNNLVDDFSDFLLSISGQRFDFEKPNPNDKLLLCKIGNNTIPFNQIESTGTSSLTLLYLWLKKIGNASLVFIDEFDAFYHFKLAFEVCKKLFNLDCQVFMSSHNTYLMTNDLLRPDCNFILNNNKIKPLNQCTDKELRFGHNIEKLFRGNAFSI